MVPASGAVSPAIMPSSVDLPLPIAPTIDTNSPSSTASETSRRTSRGRPSRANDFPTPVTSMYGTSAGAHTARSRASAMPIRRSSAKPTMPIVTMASRMCA